MDMLGQPLPAMKTGSPFQGQATTPDGRPLYLRFGEWPKRERSQINDTFESWGITELGISCYRAAYDAASNSYYYAPDEDLRWSWTAACSFSYSGRPAFLVTGEEVGLGSDGEPVLRRLRTVGYCVPVRSRANPLAPARLVPVPKAIWREMEALRGDGDALWLYVDQF